MTLRTIRIGLWTAVVLLAALATFLYFGPSRPSQTALGGGDYVLEDGTGAKVTPATLTGKPSMLFFGYTHCPDVCPTTLADMAGWYEQLGPDADKLNAFFVTVDPERDTPKVLKAYMANFDPSFIGLVPTPAQLEQVAKDFKVYYKKVEGATPTSYSMDHSAATYLYDPEGRLRLYARYGGGAPALASDIAKLLHP
jgi:protein SCO1/2